MDCFPVSPSLQKFLSLVICNDAAPNNDKTERIISLLSQGLFYAVHQRKKLTPEYSPPTFNQIADKQHRTYYHNLKTGTWCVLYKIGRGYHEVAYSRIDNNVDGMICLPEKCKKGCFTMLVEDNIDRNEETMTSTHLLLQKNCQLGYKKTIILYYCIRLLHKFVV